MGHIQQGAGAVLACIFFSTAATAVTIFPGSGGPDASIANTVTDLGGGRWSYQYQLTNLTPCVVSSCTFADGDIFLTAFDLPYFSDAGINTINDPTGWSHSIETTGSPNPFTGGGTGWDGTALWQSPTDPNYQGDTSPFTTAGQVLHWYAIPGFGGAGTVGIDPQTSLGGFAYEAAFSAIKAPHQTVFQNNVGGLPETLTGDPLIPASPSVSSVPLPTSIWLLLSAMTGLFFVGPRCNGRRGFTTDRGLQ